jgi:stearoyl-CoA desaturase (delta-9 desaturase)
VRPYEFDIGWCYIRALAFCGLAEIRRVSPQLEIDHLRYDLEPTNLDEIIDLRFEVIDRFSRIAGGWYMDERQRRILWGFQTRLEALWQQTNVSASELARHLSCWCQEAKQSGIPGLEEFGRTLPGYRKKSRT